MAEYDGWGNLKGSVDYGRDYSGMDGNIDGGILGGSLGGSSRNGTFNFNNIKLQDLRKPMLPEDITEFGPVERSMTNKVGSFAIDLLTLASPVTGIANIISKKLSGKSIGQYIGDKVSYEMSKGVSEVEANKAALSDVEATLNGLPTSAFGGQSQKNSMISELRNTGGGIVAGNDYQSKSGGSGIASGIANNVLSGSQTSYEQQSLDYLKERDIIPRQFSEGAMQGLGGIYGLEGGTGSQQETIDRALQSPLYGSIMGGQKAGEEAILRNASATGGLRSGDIQSNFYDYNTQLSNKALLESYNQQIQGLQGMAGLPGYGTQIAQQTSNVGESVYRQEETDRLMQTAQRAESSDKSQQKIDNLMGIAGLGMKAWDMFSDRRLKENIKLIGYKDGHKLYSWDWNVVARKMGLDGSTIGCMADEIYTDIPEAVSIRNHFMIVDYNKVFPMEAKNG